jgi:hypothetical protein
VSGAQMYTGTTLCPLAIAAVNAGLSAILRSHRNQTITVEIIDFTGDLRFMAFMAASANLNMRMCRLESEGIASMMLFCCHTLTHLHSLESFQSKVLGGGFKIQIQ